MRHGPTLVAATLLLAAACSGGDDAVISGSTDDIATSAPIGDLAEGAFDRNDGSADPGSDPTAERQESEAIEAAVTTTSDVEVGDQLVEDAGDSEADTTGPTTDAANAAPRHADGTTSGGAATDTGSGAETPGTAPVGDSGRTNDGTGETGGRADPADGGDTAADTGTATTDGGADRQPGSGLVRAGVTEYVFDVVFCETTSEYLELAGRGTLPGGDEFVVEVTHEIIDIDDDGQQDELFDLLVDYVTADGRDDGVPELFASKVDSATLQRGADVVLTRDGTRLSGTGSIVDFNGIAIPLDQSAPMAFEVLCG